MSESIMTSCDSVSSNLGESKIRLNSFNESKLDLNQAFKSPKLTARAPRLPSRRRRQEARGAAITSLILSPKSREPRKTRNTRKQGIREIRGQSPGFCMILRVFRNSSPEFSRPMVNLPQPTQRCRCSEVVFSAKILCENSLCEFSV
jgi:hypothetical protein